MREGEGCWVSLGEGPEGLGVDTEPHLPGQWDLVHSPPERADLSVCVEPADRQPALCSEKGERLNLLRELTARVSGFSIDWLP